MTALSLLFVGDIVGRPGRQMFRERLPELRRRHAPDLVVVNGENAAGGTGITPQLARDLSEWGADVITLGNHAWDKRELASAIDDLPNLIRPMNFPPGTPGRGSLVHRTASGVPVLVMNAMGRVFTGIQLDDPFRAVEEELRESGDAARVAILDFHAEASSEKQALAWRFDGRLSALIGTHTHVQTADEAVMPGGTAYITDVGMTGPWRSVLGMDTERVVEKYLTQMPVRFEVASGPRQLDAVLVRIDADSGRALSIERIHEREE